MKTIRWLILGDTLTIALVTLIGFATHQETSISFLPRMLAAFGPLTLAWFLVAPFLGLFQPAISADPRQLWRPVLGMLLAGPLAALGRAFLLGTVVIPVFAVVFSGTHALGMVIWRALWCKIRVKHAG
ncbi:MAG: hypothetical protein DDG60_07280 [Anaerolineae bacterium]|nr:MAG: hypothetical protein DDG60_07280 [Anaerolineae bacterium]